MQGSPETPKAPLGNNARPLQPLHHRTVRTNIDFFREQVSGCSCCSREPGRVRAALFKLRRLTNVLIGCRGRTAPPCTRTTTTRVGSTFTSHNPNTSAFSKGCPNDVVHWLDFPSSLKEEGKRSPLNVFWTCFWSFLFFLVTSRLA